MKSLPNTSPSSSSSSTSYISNNFCNSKRATSGCIRGVLRRFLCFNSIPSHPSDHLKEASNECDYKNYTNGMENADASATPGIVARLMGLDSMPTTDFSNLQMSLNTVRRCRSMDFGRENELKQGKGRHVKGTMSFRDAPAYLERENEEFFILSFEGGDDNKELGSKTRKSDMGFSEKTPRRSENKRRQSVQENNKENQENMQVSDKKLQSRMVTHRNSKDPSKVLCPIKNSHENSQSLEVIKQIDKPTFNKETPDRGRLRRRRKKKKKGKCSPVKKVETECDSENSSPVSVLDFAEFPVEFEVPTSVQNSRRTLFEELESYKKTSPLITNRLLIDGLEVRKTQDKCAIFWKKDYQSQNYEETWGEVCKFAEKETRQAKWMMYRELWDLEEFDEITTAIGFQILDQLLLELVDQVSSL